MSTDVDLFPDAEALISKVIRDELGARVYSSIPNNPTYPLITVRRIGGIPSQRVRLDNADLQFDVWGNTKSEARLLAAQARQAAFLAEGTSYDTDDGYPASAVVTGLQDILGLTWLPDPLVPKLNRYTFGLRIFLHAA